MNIAIMVCAWLCIAALILAGIDWIRDLLICRKLGVDIQFTDRYRRRCERRDRELESYIKRCGAVVDKGMSMAVRRKG